MAHVLATQVQNPDEKVAEPWWRALCCCRSKGSQQQQEHVQVQATPVDSGGGARDQAWLLDPMDPEDEKRRPGGGPLKTLVLDLDETLVHSSFTKINDADFEISIELDGSVYQVYVRKRPGVDEFMKWISDKFEVVIFTASLAKYADPLLDILDKDRIVKKRLFREACVQHFGNYVKDLSLLGRELKHSIIVDNSPFSYMFQPSNAIAITSWFNDQEDNELIEMFPKLEALMACEDVTTILAGDDQA